MKWRRRRRPRIQCIVCPFPLLTRTSERNGKCWMHNKVVSLKIWIILFTAFDTGWTKERNILIMLLRKKKWLFPPQQSENNKTKKNFLKKIRCFDNRDDFMKLYHTGTCCLPESQSLFFSLSLSFSSSLPQCLETFLLHFLLLIDLSRFFCLFVFL